MCVSSLEEQARQLLDRNARFGKDYYYTAPSSNKYPHQWSWDSAFHAIVNARLGRVDLAQKEILTLLASMLPDGRLPHLILRERTMARLPERVFRSYWPDRYRSPFVQPPVIALAVQTIWETCHDQHFLDQALPPLERHFKWLQSRRGFGNSRLVSLISPWESGLDHKPSFDRLLGRLTRLPFGLYVGLYLSEIRMAMHKYAPEEILRRGYFCVREVLFNTVYALGLESLATLFSVMGDRQKADYFWNRASDVEEAILRESYDPNTGLYFDIDVHSGRLILEPSIACLLPIALRSIPKDRRESILKHLTNPNEFWLPFPIPSLPANSRHFKPAHQRYLWRGPTWINTNWLIVNGLRRHGYHDVADSIAEKSRSLLKDSGFWEYYNPLTGEGGGEKNFSGSTLAVIM